MTIIAKLSKQGNSTGVTIPKEILDELGLERGDPVAISTDGKRIEIRPATDKRQRVMDAVDRCFTRYPRALKKLAE